jgi:hypothetical protein
LAFRLQIPLRLQEDAVIVYAILAALFVLVAVTFVSSFDFFNNRRP